MGGERDGGSGDLAISDGDGCFGPLVGSSLFANDLEADVALDGRSMQPTTSDKRSQGKPIR